MSGYLDLETLDLCRQAWRDGQTLDEMADKLHIHDTELLGRLLQLPTSKPVEPAADGFDLWAVDRLQAQL